MSHIDEGTLHAYLDGEVSAGQRAEIETHLSTCSECNDRLAAAKDLVARASGLLAELEPGVTQPPAWPEIEERAAARAAGTTRRPVIRPWLAWAASIVLAFGVGWLTSSNWSQWSEPPLSSPSETAARAVRSDDLAPARADSFAGIDALRESNVTDAAVEQPPMVPSPTDALRTAAEPAAALAEPAEGRGKAEADQEGFADTRERALDPSVGRREAAEQEAHAEGAPAEPVMAEEIARDVGDERQNELAERKQAPVPDADLALPMAQITAEGAAAGAMDSEDRFFAVQPEEAAAWLGVELRTLPDLELQRVEVGPGNAMQGGLEGLPAVRLVYMDAADHEIVLVQQRVSADQVMDAYAAESVLAVDPSGRNVYRWYDHQGYLLSLAASVSGDSLRALAERIR